MQSLPKIQYITHPEEDYSNLQWLSTLKENGVEWVQLRIKEEDLYEHHPTMHYLSTYMDIADLMRQKTKELGMILTINDLPEVARFSEADGVHLGMRDLNGLDELEDHWILGGTVHQVDEAMPFQKAHYFGCGPFSKTSTKKDALSPLGTEGLKLLIEGIRSKGMNQPVFGIGGLNLEDVSKVVLAGAYGVAVSGLIHKSGFDKGLIKELVQTVNEG